jgi:DNA-directed RNA polymerase
LKNYLNDSKKFVSRLPIYKDATCSGLQHLSLMTNNTNLAKYVNILKSNENEIPNDVYTYMVKRVNEEINILISNFNTFIKLTLLNINRKFIK